MEGPAEQYAHRLAARRAEASRGERRENLAGALRIAAALAVLAFAYLAFGVDRDLVWGLVAAAVAFVLAVTWHRLILRDLRRTRLAIAHHEEGLARLDDRWPGTGPTGAAYAAPEHPYALDLDLFGDGSLFQLLCAARTCAGQQTLAQWLLEPAATDIIRGRQAAIDELRDDLDLRETLAVLVPLQPADDDAHSLRAWSDRPALLIDRLRPALAGVLGAAAIVALVGWLAFGAGAPFLLGAAIVNGILLLSVRRQIKAATRQLDAVLAELSSLLPALRIIERRAYTCPTLQTILARLNEGNDSASRHVAHLGRLVDWWDTATRNQLVAPLAFVLGGQVQLAYGLERWRRRHGTAVTGWLAAVGEFEALVSLARFAYEHPAQPWPTFAASGPQFAATGLGHPLIPTGRRVVNDVALSPDHPLLLVSGSNMSGKSTLLRTVGVNAVLALAGAPVCADRLHLSPLAVATAMRSADSLQKGVSGFYAELHRLRAVSDLAAAQPVLFLLDEILHGTNSHDRRLGAEAIISDLCSHSAIGLITTHDLALAEVATRLEPSATNVHFADQLSAGALSFDYRLRPGVVPRSNGLALMRLLGFAVPEGGG